MFGDPAGLFTTLTAVTVLEAIQRSTAFLTRKGVEQPRLQVEWMLAHLLRLRRLDLYLNFERPLNEADLDRLRGWVQRRGQREPLQYVLGEAAFCGCDFAVSPAVLIPRPETEELAERAWTWLARSGGEAPRVLDYGTGSGCLAVLLALKVPRSVIWALEVSPAALAVANANAARHGVFDRIRFVEGAGIGALPGALQFDLVVANPPYIPSAEVETLQPEVRDHEPRLALDGGPDGLGCIRELAAARSRMQPGGRLYLEFADGQEPSVEALFRDQGWVIEAVERDLRGIPRILIAGAGRP